LTSAATTLHDFLLASPPRLQRFPPNMKSQSPFSLSPNISFPSSPGKTICHGRRSITAYWLGIVLVSVLFGYGHYYKRAAGIIYSGIAFFDLGSGIHGGDRNLWACILAHGFIDTFAVIDAFFRWSN